MWLVVFKIWAVFLSKNTNIAPKVRGQNLIAPKCDRLFLLVLALSNRQTRELQTISAVSVACTQLINIDGAIGCIRGIYICLLNDLLCVKWNIKPTRSLNCLQRLWQWQQRSGYVITCVSALIVKWVLCSAASVRVCLSICLSLQKLNKYLSELN